ncbi:MAG: hypothetical protein ABSG31_18390 [Tepidisphaeraceae bacterium]
MAQALEEPAIITQGRSLDEIVTNVRDVVQLLFNESDAQLELLVKADTPVGTKKARSRRRRTRAA